MSQKFLLIGGGGHCRSVLASLRRAKSDVIGIIDPGLEKGSLIDGVPVLGDDSHAEKFKDQALVLITVGSVGSNAVRVKLFQAYRKSGFSFGTLVDPSARVTENVTIGGGTVILASVIVNTGAKIGANCILNTGTIVEHECQVGDHAHIACGAILCGTVRVDMGAFVGAGATVRQGAKVGESAVVGAGSVILKDVPAAATVFGVH